MALAEPMVEREPWDLYPENEEEYQKLLTWCNSVFLAADRHREPHAEKWRRFYKLFRSYVRRKPGDWHSKVFMPEIFQQIETILPRLVQTLPKFQVTPVGPEDVKTAKVMEQLIQWAADRSLLHMELVVCFLDALVYGTGVLKTFPHTEYAYATEMVPVMQTERFLTYEPLIDPETQRQLLDIDNNPQTQEVEQEIEVPVGFEARKRRYVAYDGPKARAIDPFNFWPAPEAEDEDSARFLIHRTYKPWSEVQKLIAEGIYQLPKDFVENQFWARSQEMPHLERMTSVDLGSGSDPTLRQVELLEFHTNDGADSPGRVITMMNRSCLLRVNENVYWHGQKPFIIIKNYPVSHEFWGMSELEPMEGIQDAINALVNQRIDNIRLTMDQGYTVNLNQLVDQRDLVRRPGQVIRVTGDGMRPDEVIKPLDSGDISQSAFAEVQQLQSMAERVTAVSSYQQGVDTPAQLETATGAAIMNEAGGLRFQLKMKLMEMGPFKKLGRHYGSILQQFTTAERVVRMVGEDGGSGWDSIDPSSLQGALDYSVESLSAQQSETIKRQQAMEVFRLIGEVAPNIGRPDLVLGAFKDLLEAMGAKSALALLEQNPQALMPMLAQGSPGAPAPPNPMSQVANGAAG